MQIPGFDCPPIELLGARKDAPIPPHSVLTTHRVDRAGEPAREALDTTLAFLARQLKPAQAGTAGAESRP